MNGNHWAVLSTIGCIANQVRYFDSAYTSLSPNVECIIAQLFSQETNCEIKVDVMAMATQKGSSDCGLYAIAVSTALANDIDPVTLVYHQDDMRAHFGYCLEKKKMEVFTVLKTRRITNHIVYTVMIYLCPICQKCDNGTRMVQCEVCNRWYHDSCIPKYDEEKDWYCSTCSTNASKH